MLAEHSFPIAPGAAACDANQFSLRAFEWLAWDRLTISPIAAVLQAVGTVAPAEGESGIQKRDALRDEICDLLDALSSFGMQVPLTLIVSCDEANYDAWHKLAGDQDWIRGTFFIEPFTPAAFRSVGIADAAQYARMLTDVEAAHVSNYKLRTLTDADYLDIVNKRLQTEKSNSTRVLGGYIVESLSETGLLRAGEPVGQGRVERAVNRWVAHEVLPRALKALAESPTAPQTKAATKDGL
ncbi:hypothetical protein SAMN02787142_0040 [Burkholderia sp. WP9]|nr:hypothetical protein SAMN02787142_0040 [Burkholderia sp. WP9]